MYKSVVIMLAMMAFVSVSIAAGRLPWRRRIGKDVENLHLTAHKNTPPEIWPYEPKTPDKIDRDRFKRAISEICGKMPPARLDMYTDTILGEASSFEVDPFLIGALMYDQSRCWPLTPKRDAAMGRFGLTRIPLEMHAPHIRKGEYTYYIRKSDAWVADTLKVDQYPFNKWKVGAPKSNLYFAAAFLKIFSIQARSLDEVFGSAPHRHYISHWFYGDRVREPEPENRVLTARRRLLAHYDGKIPLAAGSFMGCQIVSPLDGAPRLVIDYFGNKRGKKNGLGHRGIDIDGASGEPVRAIAAGRVTFAGVDMEGASEHRMLTPEEAAELESFEMGPGGLYVSINHENEFGTIYMHLESIAVKYWDEVQAGQIIGALGRSGTKTSGPHLHLEFRVGTERTDPAVPLAAVLVDPFVNKKTN
jgi:murein DD-endopeptidase MepM/ murein hydrolase activator NlpD